MNGIRESLTANLNTFQVDTTNCFKEMNATMKQFVKQAVEEYAVQKLTTSVTEIVKKEIAVFTVDKFKHNMNARLDDLLQDKDIAKGTDLVSLEVAVEETDARHNDLCKTLAISADDATLKEQAMQADITSILGFCEAMEADMAMANLHEENANLWKVIKTKFNDVEKGEGRNVMKMSVQPSKVAKQKAPRADLPRTAPAESISTQSEMVPRPKIPQLSSSLTEKEKIAAEGKIMMDMVLQG